MSDDISEVKVIVQEGAWERPADLTAGNALAKEAAIFHCCPITAARLIEVEMRNQGARLGGAYPTANEGQAMMGAPTSAELFIVGKSAHEHSSRALRQLARGAECQPFP